jgi:hypothetical protein
MAQFQFIDSLQHLYCTSFDRPRMDKVAEGYARADAYACRLRKEAKQAGFDLVLFISDNGEAIKDSIRPTHHNRPCYSLSRKADIRGTNLRDFYNHILTWTVSTPNPGKITA